MSEVFPRLLVGLGNPGIDYQETRHNVGFMAIDRLINKVSSKAIRCDNSIDSEVWTYRLKGIQIFLQKPLTFMNLSGKAVVRLSRQEKIPPFQIIVIYDDVDLPLGRIRLRCKGSSGGHKGVESLITALETENFSRLRIGVGKNNEGSLGVVDHVLSSFSKDELPLVNNVIDKAVQALLLGLHRGIELSMTMYNGLTIKVENHNN